MEHVDLDKIEKTRLRCKNPKFELKKGFWCRVEQKQIFLKLECLLCGFGHTEIDLVKEEEENG